MKDHKLELPNNLELIMGILLGVFFCLTFLMSCTLSRSSGKWSNHQVVKERKDTIISFKIHKATYQLKIPKTYAISSGLGDDSQFLQLTNSDGSLIIGYEIGKSSGIPIHYTKEILVTLYDDLIEIPSSNEVNYLLGLKETTYTFRNLEGSLFLPNGTIYKKGIDFSCSSEKLEELVSIFKTLN